MSLGHVSVFDLKRFTEQRLGADELGGFEAHVSACADCAVRLQQAAARELGLRGLLPLPAPASAASAHRPFAAAFIALAASVMFVLSQGQAALHFPSASHADVSVSVVENGTPMQPLVVPVLGAGPAADGGLAFRDAGGR